MAKDEYKYGKAMSETFEKESGALVAVVMGSVSDWPTVKHVCDMLEQLKIPFEYGVTSAHRTPERMQIYAKSAARRGFRVIIACAGGSAHLPGMVASESTLPVLGLIPKKGDNEALGSMIRMPAGVPLATTGFDEAGAKNSALFSARMLATANDEIKRSLSDFTANQSANVPFAPK